MKKIAYKIIIILGSVFFCILLSILGYAFPVTKTIQKHALESGDQLMKEGNYPDVMSLKNTRLDNYIDALMINIASFTNSSSLSERVFANYRYDISDKGPIESLYYSRLGKEAIVSSYSRYWHGYIPFLKFTLFFTNYNGIRQINSILQILIFVLIVSLLVKRKNIVYSLAYMFCWLSLVPTALLFSLQYSSIYYIYSISLLLLLLDTKQIIKHIGYPVFFMIIGIFTSWIDFLTYPIATLGIPLIMVFILNEINNVKKIFTVYITLCFTWAIGYMGMWGIKWILSSIYLHENIIQNALQAMVFRTSNGYNGETWTKWDVIQLNMAHYFHLSYYVILLIFIITCLYSVKNRKIIGDFLLKIQLYLPFILTIPLPIAWYVILSNHTKIHHNFTFRCLSISVFAFASLFAKLLEFNFDSKKYGGGVTNY